MTENSAEQSYADDTTPSKPSFLGRLNAIALGEARGFELLRAWSDVTADEKLRDVLNVVAIRENEHAAAFEKRVCELGYAIKPKPDDDFAQRLQCASDADIPDVDKFEFLLSYGGSDGGGSDGGGSDGAQTADSFPQLFDDNSIDPTTGALLGRFIAEERDSGRRLRAEYQRIASARATETPEEMSTLNEIAERLDRLTHTLEELKTLSQS